MSGRLAHSRSASFPSWWFWLRFGRLLASVTGICYGEGKRNHASASSGRFP